MCPRWRKFATKGGLEKFKDSHHFQLILYNVLWVNSRHPAAAAMPGLTAAICPAILDSNPMEP